MGKYHVMRNGMVRDSPGLSVKRAASAPFHVVPGELGGASIRLFRQPSSAKSAQKVSKSDNDQYEWIFKGTEGKAKGKTFYYYTVFSDEQKLGKAFMAVGLEIEEDMEFDPNSVEGAEVTGTVVDDEYQGQARSKLQRIAPPDEEEEAAPPARTNSKKKAAVKLDEEEVKNMEDDELEELVSNHELEVDFAKLKTHSRKVRAVLEALAEKDLISA